jgi:APA family basic amino acid/polyamine antiporter
MLRESMSPNNKQRDRYSEGLEEDAIGYAGAIALIVGFVVGGSAFVIMSPVAGRTGPAIVFAFVIAAIGGLFTSVVFAYLGSAMPTTGASYVYAGRILGPFWGSMTGLGVFVAEIFGLAATASAFGTFTTRIIPQLGPWQWGILLIAFLFLINAIGIRESEYFQLAIVIIFVSVLYIFAAFGYFGGNIDPSNLRPLAPNGWDNVVIGGVLLFWAFIGMQAAVELGGETKNARKVLPISIGVSLFFIISVYLVTSYVLVGVVNYTELQGPTGIIRAASIVFPESGGEIFTIIAALASATTANGVLTGFSRVLVSLGRDSILPDILGRTSERFQTPVYSLGLFAGVVIIALAFTRSVVNYASAAVVIFFLVQSITAVAAFYFKEEFQSMHEDAWFKLEGFGRYFWTLGASVIFIVGAVITLWDQPGQLWVVALTVVGVPLYWFLRKQQLEKHDVNLKRQLREGIQEKASSDQGIDE